MDRDELKAKARAAFKKAEESQKQAAQALMRSRHHLDLAEAELDDSTEALKSKEVTEGSPEVLDVQNKQQKYDAAVEQYERVRASNQEIIRKMEQDKARFVEAFGEEP